MAAGSDGSTSWGAQLDRAERLLVVAGVPTPRDEAIALLSYLLDVPRPALLAQLASPMNRTAAEAYAAWVERRARGEALPHITGHHEFMGLDVRVGHAGPLIPAHARQVVELALEYCRRHPPGELLAAEIGTGCGAIALSLATLEPRFTRIYALETADDALRMARANGARYLLNLVINWLEGESLAVVPEPVDVIIWGGFASAHEQAVPTGRAGAHELPTGTAALLEQAPSRLRPGGTLICAVPHAQRPAAALLLARAYPQAQIGFEPATADVVLAVAALPRGHFAP